MKKYTSVEEFLKDHPEKAIPEKDHAKRHIKCSQNYKRLRQKGGSGKKARDAVAGDFIQAKISYKDQRTINKLAKSFGEAMSKREAYFDKRYKSNDAKKYLKSLGS